MFTINDINYLTTSEAAGLLGMKKYTLRRWCHSGIIKTIKVGQKSYIPESALNELVTARKGE